MPERLTARRAAAARASLDAPTRDRGDDLGFLDAASTHVPAPVLAAALKLEAIGELAIVADRGCSVLLVKTDGRPAQTRPEAEAREVRRRLERDHPQRITDAEPARITAPDRVPGHDDEE